MIWKMFAGASAVAAAWAGRQLATKAWSAMSDEDPPVNPADSSISWKDALGWAAVAGVSAGLARVLARRGAAAAWERATGEQPLDV